MNVMGFRSSFNFVASDYEVPAALRQHLTNRGFEVGIHGLHHNNNPFRSESIFRKQAIAINHYLKEWGSVGFRSPSMYHDLELLHHLDIEYDASTFDTDPFEPQPDGMGTIFPFWVSGNDRPKGVCRAALYPSPGFSAVYIVAREKHRYLEKEIRLDRRSRRHGPVYYPSGLYEFWKHHSHHDEYPIKYYKEFLEYIKSKYEGKYWNALPKDVSRFWVSKFKTKNFKMRLTRQSTCGAS